MSVVARLLRVVVAAAAVVGVGFGALWFTQERTGNSTPAESAAAATATPTEPATPVPPTPTPTATPAPTPTPIPTPLPFDAAVPVGDLGAELATPLPGCGLLGNDLRVAGTVSLKCIEDVPSVPVVSAAAGRVVGVVNEAAIAATGEPDPLGWSWAEQVALGPHVIVDHGPLGDATNVQTVYAGLASVAEGIGIGAVVEAGQQLGAIAGPEPTLRFSLWTNDQRQDGAAVLAAAPSLEEQRLVAEALGQVIASPTDERCPLVLSYGSLPNAPRNYRNGTHRGIDFNCGAADRSAFSIADGTVVYLVDDYTDPTVADREALLQLAAVAGFTPHWTLVMLYGNVVVVDHGEIPGAGRVVTISAHLEEVDPAIELGATVTQGQRLGELGNRGTNASALGIRGGADPTLHLHWELYVDNWYLGAGLDGGATSEIIRTALCGAAQTAGCPA